MCPYLFESLGVLIDQVRRGLGKKRQTNAGLVHLLATRQARGYLRRMMPPLGFGIEMVFMLFVIRRAADAHSFGFQRSQ